LAAALTVAGFTVGAWAQLPNVSTGATPATMTVSMTVANVNEIKAEAYPNTEIKGVNVAAAPTVRDPGNFGKVWVKTSSGKWDIKMTTDNGGRLKYTSGASTSNQCVTNWDGSQTCGNVTTGGTDNYVVYTPGSGITGNGIKVGCTSGTSCLSGANEPDTVILDVAIGMAKDGKALNVTTGTLFAIDGPASTQQIPAQIQVATIIGSQKDNVGGAISFAAILGTHYNTNKPTVPTNGAPDFSIGPSGGTGKTWSQVATDGFPAPATDQTEYFYINVGISPTNSGKLNTLVNGDYSETFYFDLYAGY